MLHSLSSSRSAPSVPGSKLTRGERRTRKMNVNLLKKKKRRKYVCNFIILSFFLKLLIFFATYNVYQLNKINKNKNSPLYDIGHVFYSKKIIHFHGLVK